MRQLSRFLPLLAMVLLACWCLFGIRNDLTQLSLSAVARSWDLIALALLLSLLNYALRIIRWRFYLLRLGHALGFRFAALTYTAGFAYTLLPGKVGELVRARYYTPVGIPLTDVTAAFLAERLMDVLAMTALGCLLLSASGRYHTALLGAAAVIAIALATLALLPWAAIAAAVRPASGRSSRSRSTLAGIASALGATRTLLRPGVLMFGFGIGLIAWGLEGAGLGLVGSMFPAAGLSPLAALGIYGIAVLIGGLSFLPGGLGSTEAVMTTLLAAHGLALSEALLLTLICRLVTLWFAVALGWCAVYLLRPTAPLAVIP
jgi:uncharacterized protein (TIRG00374 family)